MAWWNHGVYQKSYVGKHPVIVDIRGYTLTEHIRGINSLLYTKCKTNLITIGGIHLIGGASSWAMS